MNNSTIAPSTISGVEASVTIDNSKRGGDPDDHLVEAARTSEALIFIGINNHRTIVRFNKKTYITNRRMSAVEIRELLDQWIRTDLLDFELSHGR